MALELKKIRQKTTPFFDITTLIFNLVVKILLCLESFSSYEHRYLDFHGLGSSSGFVASDLNLRAKKKNVSDILLLDISWSRITISFFDL